MKTIAKHIFSNYKDLLILGISGALIGAAVGVLEALFGALVLQECTGIRTGHLFVLVPFLPLAGVLIVTLYRPPGQEGFPGNEAGIPGGAGRGSGSAYADDPPGHGFHLADPSLRRQRRTGGSGHPDRSGGFRQYRPAGQEKVDH